MSQNIKIILFIVVAVVGLLFIRFLIGGSEDTWICDKEAGEWVRHGWPSAPRPAESCPAE